MSMFQSTPANFTAGDQAECHQPDPERCFNPRPPISQRATCSIYGGTSAMGWFQSTPANFTAGDRLQPELGP